MKHSGVMLKTSVIYWRNDTITFIKQCLGYFEQQGKLAQAIPGFNQRQQQLDMVEAVAKAITDNTTLICEAGTGTGKTFAYLLPALLSRSKVIVSTASKTLQDQLYLRDIPTLTKALGLSVNTALLKGRSNYLCQQRMENFFQDEAVLNPGNINDFHIINKWQPKTKSGDIAEVKNIAENSTTWPLVTSTTDSCLSYDCDFFKSCYLQKARKQAQEADIVVINHHLFFADMLLKEEGFAELLPLADFIVIDEAHQFSKIAPQFFGQHLSSRQLTLLLNDVQLELANLVIESKPIADACDELKTLLENYHANLMQLGTRVAWPLLQLKKMLTPLSDLMELLITIQAVLTQIKNDDSKVLKNCQQRLERFIEQLTSFIDNKKQDDVKWVEVFKKSFTLNKVPLDIAHEFKRYFDAIDSSWLFTSATLTVKNDFKHIKQDLGLETDNCLQLSSPFNFKEQALFYIPKNLPDVKTEHYTQALVQQAIPVITAANGNTFFLFTSLYALRLAAKILRGKISFPLLVQGEMPKQQLLQEYLKNDNSVLLGSMSFWEGVDVKGEALSCLIIDKLPFASPSDPLVKAKLDSIKSKGGNPFNDFQVPQAVITFKQGIGRLIRDMQDKGIIMLGDSRILYNGYGKDFLLSIPEMKITRELTEVQQFYQELQHA